MNMLIRLALLVPLIILTGCKISKPSEDRPDPDRGPVPYVTVANAAVDEGDSGTTPMRFTVSLSTAAYDTVTVTYETEAGTARPGVDYVSASGSLEIPAGQTRGFISVDVIGNTVVEGDRSFTLRIASISTNAQIQGTVLAAQGTIMDDDGAPTVSVADAEVLEGDADDITALVFTLKLNRRAHGPVEVTYSTKDETAEGGRDYVIVSREKVTIPAGSVETTVEIDIRGDDYREPDETLILVLDKVSDNARLGAGAEAIGTILNDDMGRLNDTGVTVSGDAIRGYFDDCSADGVVYLEQDCSHGRDADPATNDDMNGHAGFRFTKLDNHGKPLLDQYQLYSTTPWACVLDEVTGLFWEVKTTDGGLRHNEHSYTYFDSQWLDADGSDGGSSGTDSGTDGIYAGPVDTGINSYFDNCGNSDAICTTEQYVADVNEQGLCGYGDWRLPTREELRSIVNYDGLRTPPTAVDANYFPNMMDDGSHEWTSSLVLNIDSDGEAYSFRRYALHIKAGTFAARQLDGGTGSSAPKHRVRLVRN